MDKGTAILFISFTHIKFIICWAKNTDLSRTNINRVGTKEHFVVTFVPLLEYLSVQHGFLVPKHGK